MTEHDRNPAGSGIDFLNLAQWRGGVDAKLEGIDSTLCEIRKDQKDIFKKFDSVRGDIEGNSNRLAYWSGAVAVLAFALSLTVALIK